MNTLTAFYERFSGRKLQRDMSAGQSMAHRAEAAAIPQYGAKNILLVWAAAAIPMAILGWLVAPALANDLGKPVLVRMGVLTVGLIWQFVIVLFMVYREAGNLRLSTLSHRLWLNTPRSPKTGEPRGRLWLWLIPLFIVATAYMALVSGMLDKVWVSIFPFLAEPQGFSLAAAIATPEAKAQLVGAWDVLGVFALLALFNTFLGEELLFRGLLLPRMSGVFGKWDWVMNGLLFSLYHLHQPWGMLGYMFIAIFVFALPSRYFRSSWFGIILHSGQSILNVLLILGLVLGLA